MKKHFGIALVALMSMGIFTGFAQNSSLQSSRENGNQDDSEVFIAVNTGGGSINARTGYYVDRNGNLLFNKKFSGVSPFSKEGLASVYKRRTSGIINTKGRMVIPFGKYDYEPAGAGLIRKSDLKTDKAGYIDLHGKEVVPCIYDRASDFSDGLAVVSVERKEGVVNSKGEIVIPCLFDEIGIENDKWERNDRSVFYVKQKDKYGFFDAAGKQVIPFIYDRAREFHEDLAAVSIDGKYGFIDKAGHTVIPFIYDQAHSFHEGLAAVKKDGKYGYIDKSGKVVIPFIIVSSDGWNGFEARDFSEGLVVIKMGDKYGCMDKEGVMVVPCAFDKTYSCAEGMVCVQVDQKYGYYDKAGKLVIPVEYEDAHLFSEGLAFVKKDGKYGCIDKEGNVVLPFVYDGNGFGFCQGLAHAHIGDKWGVINRKGKWVVPPVDAPSDEWIWWEELWY